jgi:hypothetical protein
LAIGNAQACQEASATPGVNTKRPGDLHGAFLSDIHPFVFKKADVLGTDG